jgi:putative ABC transport system permease protein
MLASLTGVEKLAPKLSVPAQINGQPVTLTGILPQDDFKTKATWQTATLLQKKHAGCKKAACGTDADALTPEALSSTRVIQALKDDQAIVGVDVATQFDLKAGSSLELLGGKFKVLTVLPTTGTVDDSRVFAHLHKVQELSKSGEVINAIEVLGCCEDAAGQLVPQLAELLPNCKVVTISQVVQTQVGVNRLMARASLFVVAVLILVGGASVASAISSNVRERRREIGTLMALGATPGLVSRMFLLKATWLGLVGGIGGGLIGTVLAMWLGPHWAGVTVSPLFDVTAVACVAALGVTLLAAYWPARQAARLDPCTCFQEV